MKIRKEKEEEKNYILESSRAKTKLSFFFWIGVDPFIIQGRWSEPDGRTKDGGRRTEFLVSNIVFFESMSIPLSSCVPSKQENP